MIVITAATRVYCPPCKEADLCTDRAGLTDTSMAVLPGKIPATHLLFVHRFCKQV